MTEREQKSISELYKEIDCDKIRIKHRGRKIMDYADGMSMKSTHTRSTCP